MISNRPYLLRAFFQWIVDSNCTPILVIDANHPRCKIPQDYAEGGEIVFNISPTAVRDLKMANDAVEFKASFTSVVHLIHAPIKAILAVYAEENGEGIFFDAEEDMDDEAEVATNGNILKLQSIEGGMSAESFMQDILPGTSAAKSKPALKLVE
ncbi:MAG: ClpXP protease specificity-enhancing factor [Gammaproteobacteria bacterium]